MVFFVTFLRALAALIITNAHYTGVYPYDIIANGGLLGDVIFFAVSGFCLYNVKMSFGKWYLRRILRVYPAPLIVTVVYMILGYYARVDSFSDFVKVFIYPTNYHFVASIIILYIPVYFVLKYDKLRNHIPEIMFGTFIVAFLIYLFIYDRSYYHIDTVREPMIRFLFFEAMLMGAYFKHNFEKYRDNFKIWNGVAAGIVFVIYFVSKLAFSKKASIADFQIINQMVLMLLLYFVLKCFAGIDSNLEELPLKVKRIISYLSEITLEIYVVQYAIIPPLANRFNFPVNWIVITATILIVASLLRIIVKVLNKQTDKLFIGNVRNKI